MDLASIRRRTVALVAAYALALQALLLSFAPAMPVTAVGAFALLCSQVDTGGADHPGQHEHSCLAVCAALGQGLNGVPAATVAAPLATTGGLIEAAATGHRLAPPLAMLGPHAPRGPPSL